MELLVLILIMMFIVGLFIMAILKNGHPLLQGVASFKRLKSRTSQRKIADVGNVLYFGFCLFMFVGACIETIFKSLAG